LDISGQLLLLDSGPTTGRRELNLLILVQILLGHWDAFFRASRDSAPRAGRSLNHQCCRKKNKKMQMFDHLVASKVLAHAITGSSSSRKTSRSSSCSSCNNWQQQQQLVRPLWQLVPPQQQLVRSQQQLQQH
jgi:hypothetical protein